MQHLDRQDSDHILVTGQVNWLPLHENIVEEKKDIPDPG